MSASEIPDREWETQAEVDACLAETGVTRDQVRRLRWEGLLPDVEQTWPEAFRGSETRYPIGTCSQIKATKQLFETKNRVDFVGWELWWRGFPVDERHWRPRVERVAKSGDILLSFLRRRIKQDEERDSANALFEHIAEKQPKQSILAKINRRVGIANLPAMWSIVLPTAAGAFNSNLDPSDEKALTNAFDVSQSQRDRILGHQLRLRALFGRFSRNYRTSAEGFPFSKPANFPTAN